MSKTKFLWTVGVASASSLLTFICITWIQKRRISNIKSSLKSYGNTKSRIASDFVNEELVQEQLTRNFSFLGKEGMARLESSFVIVVGLGGVGSHAAHMLLRSGVRRLRLIDFDQVTLSSLNRHAVATQSDVGTPKALCLQKHFKEIAPWAVVDARTELFTKDSAHVLLEGNPDLVFDCIDNLDTKIELIRFCVENKIKILSSMGAAAKIDPSRIQIADISATHDDPLARATRRKLKKVGVNSGVPVVYSTERQGIVKLLPLEESMLENANEYSVLPAFRVRILPVIGTLPASFGCAMSSWAVATLSGFPIDPLPIKNRRSIYLRLFKDLLAKEREKYSILHLPLEMEDVGYVYDEIWRGKSALSGSRDNLKVVRWLSKNLPTVDNLISLTSKEAKAHEECISLFDLYSPEFIEMVETKFQEERKISEMFN